MLSNANNTNAIQRHIYEETHKESKKNTTGEKIRKFMAKWKSGGGAKKGQKQFLQMPLASPGIKKMTWR